MACCIYVAFIISRLLAACETVRRYFGATLEDKTAAAQAWRLDSAEAPSAPLPAPAPMKDDLQRRKPSFIAVLAVGLTLLIAVGIWFT
jgi:hypothetical protein